MPNPKAYGVKIDFKNVLYLLFNLISRGAFIFDFIINIILTIYLTLFKKKMDYIKEYQSDDD